MWSREELLAALPERVAPAGASAGYTLALTVVAAVLVLLPLLYLGLTLLVAYGVYWHFAHGQWLFDSLGAGRVRGKGVILLVIAWAAPGVIGAILVLFMFKPLLSWRRFRGQRPTLSRADEPLLYDYVDRLCDALGAPRPVRIDYDNAVNASAGFASNWSFVSNQLVLTLGLPLVSGMDLRQVTGVMAHEFGHFSQFWAMRLGRVIETVNDWFERVVEERDTWDDWLEQSSQAVDFRIGWVLWVAQFFVWLVRNILTGFRCVGLFFSRRLSRQMEFDADRSQILVAGSGTFAAIFERLAVLDLAADVAERSARQFLREGKAIDDFARFVVYHANELPRDKLQPVLEAVRNQPAPWISTHPSDSERGAAAERMGATGNYTLDCPATVLFRDFRSVSRELTRRWYSKSSGEAVGLDELTSVDELIAEQKRRRGRYEAARRFVMFADLALVRWGEDRGDLPTDESHDALWADLRTARQTMEQELAAYRTAAREWQECSAAGNLLQAARLPVVFGDKVDQRQHPLLGQRLETNEQINTLASTVGERYQAIRLRLTSFENACSRRLLRGLQLAPRSSGSAEAVAAELQRLWPAFQRLLPTTLLMEDHEPTLNQLEWLFRRLAKRPNDTAASELLEKIAKRGIDEMNRIWGHLSEVTYPFDLPYETEHLAQALLSHFADRANPYAVYGDLRRFADSYWSLWRRLIGRLTEIAEQTEARGGLTPLLTIEPKID
ncbi:MAG: M48 family metalloprotease [Planctomycetaceae bacterium]|nr:M48 family metalloprotease [Planctomycetaceae bacterium]